MFQILSNDFPIIHLLLSSLLNYNRDSCQSNYAMLTSNESFALNVGLTFLNAVLHYILYRIAVAFILFIKSSIFWVLSKTDCFLYHSNDKRRRCPGKDFNDDPDESADEYVTS